MKTVTCLLLGTAAVALAGCSQLPGSSLGATFGAERYLKADHGGPGSTGALAKEYTELGRRAAFRARPGERVAEGRFDRQLYQLLL